MTRKQKELLLEVLETWQPELNSKGASIVDDLKTHIMLEE